MSELTKEEFEKILEKQLSNTKKDIIHRIDESQDELARMVADGFKDMRERFDVKDKVEKHERVFKFLAEHFNMKEIESILK
ncbi:MAG: hypothetical protein JNN11_03680 [Candidatus Doudnabacteria bacterium]|nr:hypothetical protein [Candidatus Doudnabacteria bacterium]